MAWGDLRTGIGLRLALVTAAATVTLGVLVAVRSGGTSEPVRALAAAFALPTAIVALGGAAGTALIQRRPRLDPRIGWALVPGPIGIDVLRGGATTSAAFVQGAVVVGGYTGDVVVPELGVERIRIRHFGDRGVDARASGPGVRHAGRALDPGECVWIADGDELRIGAVGVVVRLARQAG